MQFNANKCENKRKPLTHDHGIHGLKLQTVKNAKYLGATISLDLSWNTHVDITDKKATTSLNFLKRNLHSSLSTVKEKCQSLVRPVMEYDSCVWKVSKGEKTRNRYNQVPHLTQDTNGKVTKSHTQRNINKLEMVQRRVARFVKGE